MSYIPCRRPASVLDGMNHPVEKRARKLVLCFDGTGNKFRGDDSDSNILKIFRMLDRNANDQCRCLYGRHWNSHYTYLFIAG